MTFSNRPYQDRGKKKWRGFMLSEHTASLEAEERKPQDWKEAMSQESIVAVLHQAVSQRAVLRIQIYKDLGESPGPDVLG
ncbi:hypothetical protein DUK53_17090 [Listeria sp. SHR_NRA_18]|nr:hypothetical protein DUK53_17090 [Listeria sp. SHR_NRA_18]